MIRDFLAGRYCCREQTETRNTTGVVTTTISEDSRTREEEHENEPEPERENQHMNEQERRKQFNKKISTAFITGVLNYLSDDEDDEDE